MFPNSDESGKQSLYSDGDPDWHQNLITSSLAHCQPSLKISCKSAPNFLRKVANKERERQTDNDDYNILPGECNYRILKAKKETLVTASYRERALRRAADKSVKQALTAWYRRRRSPAAAVTN